MANWRSFAVPWIDNDVHEQIKTMERPAFSRIFIASAGPNLAPRWNGSIFYPAKIPDLIALKGQKYIDHSGTHKLRGLGDIMRYAALVSYSGIGDFGSHRMLTETQRKIPYHLPDEALYALAVYVDSIEPPPNPNKFDEKAAAGKKAFDRECSGCHTPPYYTNGKLTLAEGFTPPAEMMREYDVLPLPVKTDPSLALKTRKGPGFYKVPSLRGVWYRGRYLHDGALTSLEEMFNPARLDADSFRAGSKAPTNIGRAETESVEPRQASIFPEEFAVEKGVSHVRDYRSDRQHWKRGSGEIARSGTEGACCGARPDAAGEIHRKGCGIIHR
jgi:hypothetical protein